ncbi:MAG TPA: CRISPR-associated ring nuclease Csm6 [Pyrinomonadaceae bacterium]|nr:CRISPR-associated ring nuclease Csm6 [Pyrinomonadaceae bacterium]
MKKKSEKNILLCVAGLTPPIITETLHVLAVKEKRRIDEIRVITTTQGEKRVKESLFDSGIFQEFCRDYPEETAKLCFNEKCLYLLNDRKTGIPSDADFPEDRLPDIRTTGENEKAANQICEIVRFWTRDENSERVFATVAGGRKTMGNYLAFAMSLFGRRQDRLSHVLVSEEFERVGKPPVKFYYEPPAPRPVFDIKNNPVFTADGKPLTTDMARTTLAEIPFVRLRRILSEDYGDQPGEYASFVKQVQDELDLLETDHPVKIHLNSHRRKIAKHAFSLTPGEMLMYAIFARQRRTALTEEKAALLYDEILFEHFENAIRLITAADGDEYGLDCVMNGGTPYDFLINYLVQKQGRLVNGRINRVGINEKGKEVKLNKTLHELVRDVNAKLEDKRIPDRFMIKPQRKTKNVPHNWLAVSPDKIVFMK